MLKRALLITLPLSLRRCSPHRRPILSLFLKFEPSFFSVASSPLARGFAISLSPVHKLRTLIRDGKPEEAHSTLRQMIKLRIRRQVHDWEALIKAYAAAGNVRGALQVLEEMKADGFIWTASGDKTALEHAIMFQILEGLGKSDAHDAASQFMAKLKSTITDSFTLRTAYKHWLVGILQSGDNDKAYKLYKSNFGKSAHALVPNEAILTAMVCGLASNNAVELCEQLLRDTESEWPSFHLLSEGYVALIQLYGVKNNNLTAARHWFDRARLAGPHTCNSEVYAAFFSSCLAALQTSAQRDSSAAVAMVTDVLQQWHEAQREPPLSRTAIHSAILALVYGGRAGAAIRLYDEMKQHGMQPYAETVATILEAYSATEQPQSARQEYVWYKRALSSNKADSLLVRGFALLHSTLVARVLQAYVVCGDFAAALVFFRTEVSENVQSLSDGRAHCALIKLLCAAEEYAMAAQVWDEFVESRLQQHPPSRLLIETFFRECLGPYVAHAGTPVADIIAKAESTHGRLQAVVSQEVTPVLLDNLLLSVYNAAAIHRHSSEAASKARALCARMQLAQAQLDPQYYAEKLKLESTRNDDTPEQKIQSLIHTATNCGVTDDYVMAALIRAIAKVGGTSEVILRLQQLQNDDRIRGTLGPLTYHAAIEECAAHNIVEQAYTLLDQLRQTGHRPIAQTYTTLLRACITHLARTEGEIDKIFKKVVSMAVADGVRFSF